MKKIIDINGTKIVFFQQNEEDYISLTDMVKNIEDGLSLIEKWLRNKNTIEFLGIWEQINNENFNSLEFGGIKNQAGLNRFTLSVKKWIAETNAVGIISKSGRYGGTYAHKDIAFEFATWISPEFKLYLIKEFQRLKSEENDKKLVGWDVKRNLAKINYSLQTDAIKSHLIPTLSEFKQKYIYAEEADLLNLIVFGKTANIWENENLELSKTGNIRDYANILELSILSNLESFNSEFIKSGFSKEQRFEKLSQIAESQKNAILKNSKNRLN